MPLKAMGGVVKRFGRHGVFGAGAKATARSTQNSAIEAIGGGMRSGKPFAMGTGKPGMAIERYRGGVPAVRGPGTAMELYRPKPIVSGGGARRYVPPAPNPKKTSPGFFAQHGKKVAAGVAIGALGAGVMTSRTGKGVDAQTGLPRGNYNY
jgi:hypothetical protein